MHPYQYGYSSPLVNTDHSGRCSRDAQSLDESDIGSMCDGGSGGGSGDDIGPINGGRQDIPAMQPPPHPLQNPNNWRIPQTPYVPEGSAGPLTPPAPSAPRPAPQPYTPGGFPLPAIPTRYLPGMMQCASDLDPYERTQPQPQPYPQQARPDTDEDRKREKDIIYRDGPNKPKTVRLNRQVDWETGISFSTTPPAQPIRYSVTKLRMAGFIVEFDGGIPTTNVRNGDPWIDPKTGKQHIPGPNHVRVYHPSLTYWDEWYHEELANKGTTNVTPQTLFLYELRER